MPSTRSAPSSRPTLVDYLLLMIGFALSSVLYVQLRQPSATPGPNAAHAALRDLLAALPALLWPLFLATQRLLGRKQGLTVAEWLWVFAWLGTATMIGLGAWNRWGTVPEFLRDYRVYPALVWYVILVPSMALIALLAALFGVFSGSQRPWTHNLAIVLLAWPVLPLAGLLALSNQVEWMKP